MGKLDYVALHSTPSSSWSSWSSSSSRRICPPTAPILLRRPPSSFAVHVLIACVLVVVDISPTSELVRHVDAGISFGGVTSTDACYDSLQRAEMSDGSGRVDRDGYVSFVNELSGYAFESFGYDEASGTWGMHPVAAFEDLPSTIRGEFYDAACGGPFVVCEEAYLYTSGTKDDANPQDVIYLFELCSGVQDAIDEELASMTSTAVPTEPSSVPVDGAYPTSYPTTPAGFAPTSTMPTSSTTTDISSPAARETFPLSYRAAVSSSVIAANLNDPNVVYRSQLLGAMTTWTMSTAYAYNADGGGEEGRDGSALRARRRRRAEEDEAEVKAEVEAEDDGRVASLLRGGRKRREGGSDRGLLVNPVPSLEADGTSVMNVVDIECSEEIKADLQQDTDHCIEVTTNVTLEFVDEPLGYNRTDAIVYFVDQFEIDVTNGKFHDMIAPPSTKSEFRTIYSAMTPIAGNATTTDDMGFDVDEFIQENEEISEKEGGGGGGSNTAGIAVGVCICLVVVGIVGFLVHRRRSANSWWFHDKSQDDAGADKSKDGRESYATPDFDVVERDLKARRRDDDQGSRGSEASSRDRISSGRSDSDSDSESASMASFSSTSESDSDSDSSTASTESSHDELTSGGPASAYSLTPSDIDDHGRPVPKGLRDKSTSPRDDGRASKRNVVRPASMGSRTPTEDDSSAGSSGWDSSDDESTVGTGSVESYKGDLDSSTSGGKGTASISTDSSTLYQGQGPMSNPPAINYKSQRGVTMVPIVEEALRSSTSSNSTQPYAATPDGSIEEAIEMGDWAAVGATAAILASSKSSVGARVEADDDYSDSSVESDVDDDDDSSSRDSSGRVRYGVRVSAESVGTDANRGSNESAGSYGVETTDSDVARAAEIDRLVESGNWDGVVAVAARYVEEADEADEQLKRPLRRGGSPSSRIAESDVESVSIETADESSAYTDSSRESTYATSGNNTAGSRTGTSSSNDANATRSRSNTSTSSDVGSRNVVGETVATLSESVSSTSDVQTISTHSSSSHHRRRKNAYRAEVEALVRRVVPDELSNVDDILVQFSGREQELIDTLRAMQEKSIAQRARAAVQRSAKKEAGKSGRDPMDDESSDGNSSSQPDRSVATQDPSERLSNQSPRDRRDSESITSQFAETETEEYSMSESSEGASYTTGASDSRSGTNGSEYSGPGKVRYDTTRASTGLVDAIDASDWRAVGANANELRRGREDSVSPPLGTTGIKDMVEEGNWSGIIEAASNMTRNGEIEDLD